MTSFKEGDIVHPDNAYLNFRHVVIARNSKGLFIQEIKRWNDPDNEPYFISNEKKLYTEEQYATVRRELDVKKALELVKYYKSEIKKQVKVLIELEYDTKLLE